jgi:hypothetical protein
VQNLTEAEQGQVTRWSGMIRRGEKVPTNELPEAQRILTKVDKAVPPRKASAARPTAKGLPKRAARIDKYPTGLVHQDLNRADAGLSYRRSIKSDPKREVATYMDLDTQKYVCVQGETAFVTTEWMQLPEFAGRRWQLVRHYHPPAPYPGKYFPGWRLPSSQDFVAAMGGSPAPRRKIVSFVDHQDPSGRWYRTEFGFDPKASPQFYVRYRSNTGTEEIRYFQDVPWKPNSDFQRFRKNFTGDPGEGLDWLAAGTSKKVQSP